MQTCSSMYLRAIPQVQAVILTPKSSSYGSLELDKLAEFQSDLDRFIPDESVESVILDLSAVAHHGSGLLTLLIELAARLRLDGITLVICGDGTGLVQLVGGQAWCENVSDLAAALELCAAGAGAS